MGIARRIMAARALLLACAVAAACGAFELNSEDGVSSLPHVDANPPDPVQPSLKADTSYEVAQETLKQAAAIPDPSPNDYGLASAKQAAQAQAFEMESNKESEGDALLMGESRGTARTRRHKSHIDALMGKLIMSDLFSSTELQEMKTALNRYGSSHHDIGESMKSQSSDVAMAKGLALALASKAAAEKKLKVAKEEFAKAAKRHDAQKGVVLASLNQCKAELANKPSAPGAKHEDHEPNVQKTNTLSPCCSACSKLSQDHQVLIKADCSGCPREAQAAKRIQVTTKVSHPKGMSECCQACSQLSKAEKHLLKADCSGC